MSSGEILTLVLILLVPAALLWAVFLTRTGGRRRRVAVGIPPALRPGQPDEVLEGRRLERIQIGWLLSILVTAVFIPFYWLPEGQRQEAFEERFEEESVHRGKLIFSAPPELPEEADPAEFKELEEGIALGQGCAGCHGGVNKDPAKSALGGFAQPCNVCPANEDGDLLVQYQAPPLQNVFTRWDEEVVRLTIERGRPGTPMPAWGVEFGGSMTDLMVDDVIAWLKTLPGNQTPPPPLPEKCRDEGTGAASPGAASPEQGASPGASPAPGASPTPEPLPRTCGREIFEARCAVCHGPQGQGKEAGIGTADAQTIWYQGLALWQGDVRHLPKWLHQQTIINGRRLAWMPQFGEAPAQGIPVPPYPLTPAQIEAVMRYERTL